MITRARLPYKFAQTRRAANLKSDNPCTLPIRRPQYATDARADDGEQFNSKQPAASRPRRGVDDKQTSNAYADVIGSGRSKTKEERPPVKVKADQYKEYEDSLPPRATEESKRSQESEMNKKQRNVE